MCMYIYIMHYNACLLLVSNLIRSCWVSPKPFHSWRKEPQLASVRSSPAPHSCHIGRTAHRFLRRQRWRNAQSRPQFGEGLKPKIMDKSSIHGSSCIESIWSKHVFWIHEGAMLSNFQLAAEDYVHVHYELNAEMTTLHSIPKKDRNVFPGWYRSFCFINQFSGFQLFYIPSGNLT